MTLKPINLIQAAESDLRTRSFNKGNPPPFRQYAFHRSHVRKADAALKILRLALTSPPLDTAKKNTKLLYEDKKLLEAAIRLLTETDLSPQHRHPGMVDGGHSKAMPR